MVGALTALQLNPVNTPLNKLPQKCFVMAHISATLATIFVVAVSFSDIDQDSTLFLWTVSCTLEACGRVDSIGVS